MTALDVAVFAACVLALAVLPWMVPFWPTQDEYDHLAVVHAFRELADPASPLSRYLVRGQLSPSPYVLQYWVLLGLGHWMDLTTASRVVASGIIAGIPLSTLCLAQRVTPERAANVLLVVPFATGFLLFMGFSNFLMGVVFALVALAFALGPTVKKSRDFVPASVRELAVAAGALCLAMLAHPLAAALVGVAWLAFEGPKLAKLRTWRRMAIVAIPAGIVAVLPFLLRPAPMSQTVLDLTFTDVWRRLKDLFVDEQWGLSRGELPFRWGAIALLLGGSGHTVLRAGIRGTTRDAGLARIVVVLFAAYLFGPTSLSSKINNYIDTRVALALILLCALTAELPRWFATRARRNAIGGVLAIGTAIVQYRALPTLSRLVATIDAAATAVPRGASVLSLDFTSPKESNFRPRVNAWGILTLRKDAVTPYVFADSPSIDAGRFRPLRFRNAFGKDFLPLVHGARHWMRKTDEYRVLADYPAAWTLVGEEMLETAARYDRVLAIAPPEEFLELARRRLTVEYHADDVWVLRPRDAQ